MGAQNFSSLLLLTMMMMMTITVATYADSRCCRQQFWADPSS